MLDICWIYMYGYIYIYIYIHQLLVCVNFGTETISKFLKRRKLK